MATYPAGVDFTAGTLVLPGRSSSSTRVAPYTLSSASMSAVAVHGHRAVHALVEAVVAAQRLDVAVEDEADDLAVLVHHGRAGVAADDVVGGGRSSIGVVQVELLLGRRASSWAARTAPRRCARSKAPADGGDRAPPACRSPQPFTAP